jgi:hypothetical protein
MKERIDFMRQPQLSHDKEEGKAEKLEKRKCVLEENLLIVIVSRMP